MYTVLPTMTPGANRPVGRLPSLVRNFLVGTCPSVACTRPRTRTAGTRTRRPALVMAGIHRYANRVSDRSTPGQSVSEWSLEFHYAAHGFGGGREEVASAVPMLGLVGVHQPQVRCVD